MTYENNLLALRLKNHMSQSEFADEIGMNVTVYARYERGERDLPMHIAKQIAFMFDTDLNYICCFDKPYDIDTIELNADQLVEEQEQEREKAIEKFEQMHKRKRFF